MANRTISWSAALRELKADRLTRLTVREERLRVGAGGRGSLRPPLSAWRGSSGRRYVVVVLSLDVPDLVADGAAVVLAVSRGGDGRAGVVAARACEGGDPGFLGWLAACAARGASELHAHRLAETAEGRKAIAADLGGPAAPGPEAVSSARGGR